MMNFNARAANYHIGVQLSILPGLKNSFADVAGFDCEFRLSRMRTENMRNKFSPDTLILSPAAGLAGWTGLQLTTFSCAPERTLPDEAASQNFDDVLVERILAGDDDAFEQIVARHSRRVFAIARKFFRSAETVEDIAQETF